MKKIRNFLLGLDLMLVCILAGAAAEEGMEYFIKNRAKEKENRPVMQINRTEEELSEASFKAYQEQLESLGMSRILEIRQAAYDRYTGAE